MKARVMGILFLLMGILVINAELANASEAGKIMAKLYYDELEKIVTTPQTPSQDFEAFCKMMEVTFNKPYVAKNLKGWAMVVDRDGANLISEKLFLGYLAAYSIATLNTIGEIRDKGNLGYTWVGSETITNVESNEIAKFKVRIASDADEVHLYLSKVNSKINNIGTSSVGITLLQSAGANIEKLKGTGRNIADALGNFVVQKIADQRFKAGCP